MHFSRMYHMQQKLILLLNLEIRKLQFRRSDKVKSQQAGSQHKRFDASADLIHASSLCYLGGILPVTLCTFLCKFCGRYFLPFSSIVIRYNLVRFPIVLGMFVNRLSYIYKYCKFVRFPISFGRPVN